MQVLGHRKCVLALLATARGEKETCILSWRAWQNQTQLKERSPATNRWASCVGIHIKSSSVTSWPLEDFILCKQGKTSSGPLCPGGGLPIFPLLNSARSLMRGRFMSYKASESTYNREPSSAELLTSTPPACLIGDSSRVTVFIILSTNPSLATSTSSFPLNMRFSQFVYHIPSQSALSGEGTMRYLVFNTHLRSTYCVVGTKCFTNVNLLNPQQHPMRQARSLAPTSRWGNWNTDPLQNALRVMQLWGRRAGIWTQTVKLPSSFL